MTSNSNKSNSNFADNSKDLQEWQKESDKRKLFWVIATVGFIFTTAFQGALYLLQGTINLILICVILALMVMGTVFKIRYQSYQNSKPKPLDII